MLKQLYFCHLNPNLLFWVEESLDPQAEADSPDSCSKSLLFYQNDQRNKLKITLRKTQD